MSGRGNGVQWCNPNNPPQEDLKQSQWAPLWWGLRPKGKGDTLGPLCLAAHTSWSDLHFCPLKHAINHKRQIIETLSCNQSCRKLGSSTCTSRWERTFCWDFIPSLVLSAGYSRKSVSGTNWIVNEAIREVVLNIPPTEHPEVEESQRGQCRVKVVFLSSANSSELMFSEQ